MKKLLMLLTGTVVMLVSVIVFAKESTLTGWSVNKNGVSEYEVVCDREIVSGSGSNSLRMYIEEKTESGYIELRSVGIVPEKSVEYVFEFDYMTDTTLESLATTVYAGSATRNLIAAGERTLAAGEGWQSYSAEFTTLSNQSALTVRLKFSEEKVNLWIDNLSLHKKGSDENVLINADMDVDLNTQPQAVTELKNSDVRADDITVSWVNPDDDDFDYIIVNDIITGTETYLRDGETSFSIESAPRETEYCFEITAVDIDGNRSVPKTISFRTEYVEYIIGKPVTEEENGKVKVSITAVNNKVTDGLRLTLICFLYSGTERVDSQAIIENIPQTGEEKNTSLVLALPEGKTLADCKLKTYVFDTFLNMREIDNEE